MRQAGPILPGRALPCAHLWAGSEAVNSHVWGVWWHLAEPEQVEPWDCGRKDSSVCCCSRAVSLR